MYTKDNWIDAIAAMHSGQEIEIDSDIFDYFLGVLPPVYMDCNKFGFAEGREKIVDFWAVDGKFFCRQSNKINVGA